MSFFSKIAIETLVIHTPPSLVLVSSVTNIAELFFSFFCPFLHAEDNFGEYL